MVRHAGPLDKEAEKPVNTITLGLETSIVRATARAFLCTGQNIPVAQNRYSR